MTEAWHDGLPDDAFKTEEMKAYEQAIIKIKEGLSQGLDFDSACNAISIDNADLRAQIIDDMLKIIIAEEHFAKNVPLVMLADALKIPVDRLDKAKEEMFQEVERQSVDAFYRHLSSGDESG